MVTNFLCALLSQLNFRKSFAHSRKGNDVDKEPSLDVYRLENEISRVLDSHSFDRTQGDGSSVFGGDAISRDD